MSEEAKGSCGKIIGTEDYFKELNDTSRMSKIMKDNKKYDYHDTIEAISAKAQNCMDEILDDLDNKAEMLRFISRDTLIRTENFIKSLESICEIAGSYCSKANSCFYLLELRDSKTGAKTNASTSELKEALNIVKHGGKVPISSYDRMNILEKAVKSGISWAVGNDELKKEYINEILQGNNEDFLIDVWNMLCYYDNKGLKGKCGYDICSERYLQYHEAEVFGSGFRRSDKRGYEKEILNSLEKIAKDIEKDLNDAIYANDYIKTKNAVNIKEALNDLRKCKISAAGNLDDKIMSLDWYVGGDKDKIREIQQGLNGFFETKRLLEDGVYGEKTKEALNDFVERANEDIVAFFKNQKAIEATSKLIENENYYNQIDIENKITALRQIIITGRKALQYAMWNIGILYLKAQGADFSAICLKNAIENANSMYFNESLDIFGAVKAIKKSDEFKEAVSGFMSSENIREVENFQRSYQVNLEFKKTQDLYLSLGKVDFEIEVHKSENTENLWYLSCHIKDTYDFTSLRSYCISETGMTTQLNLTKGGIANDLGVLSQIDEVIKPYKIWIDFNIVINYNGKKYVIVE